MNTAELVSHVADQTGIPKDGVRKVLFVALDVIADAIKAGQPVVLSGFGQFKALDRKSVKVGASRRLAFIATQRLRDHISS
jgi:nucleoid DNA-binding protein